jgi:hypothetical protein
MAIPGLQRRVCAGPKSPGNQVFGHLPRRPAGPGLAGRQRRAPPPLRCAPLPGQRDGPPGRSLLACSVRIRSGSPLFNVSAVRLLSLSGVTPASPPQCVRPDRPSRSLLPCGHLHVCKASGRLPRAGSPGCAGRRPVAAEGGHFRAHPQRAALLQALAVMRCHIAPSRDNVQAPMPGAPRSGNGPDAVRRCDALITRAVMTRDRRLMHR